MSGYHYRLMCTGLTLSAMGRLFRRAQLAPVSLRQDVLVLHPKRPSYDRPKTHACCIVIQLPVKMVSCTLDTKPDAQLV